LQAERAARANDADLVAALDERERAC